MAIDTLFNEEKDLILIAKTVYGKGMVFLIARKHHHPKDYAFA